MGFVADVPSWVRRLGDLPGQIKLRQIELAKPADPSETAPKSVRNKGSMESPNPTNEPPDPTDNAAITAMPGAPPVFPDTRQAPGTNAPAPVLIGNQMGLLPAPTPAAAAVTMADACPTSAATVFFDSYTQAFFAELSKWISALGFKMQKAKRAANIEKIRKRAELELPSNEYKDAESVPDLVEELTNVETMCQYAASQVLRNGHCNEEIEKIKTLLWKLHKRAWKLGVANANNADTLKVDMPEVDERTEE